MTQMFECSFDVEVACTGCESPRDWPESDDVERHLEGDSVYADLKTPCGVCGAYRVRIDVSIG